MVAIRHWEADKFLARPPGHTVFYLFYGSDSGLASERARNLVRNFVDNPDDAFQLIRMEGDALAAETGRLADEAYTMGLFGGRRAIWIKAGTRNLVPAFEPLIEDAPRETIIVVEAGALKKDSALRKLYEREKLAAAVECSHDTPEQLRQIIEAEARQAGVSLDIETLDLLSHTLGDDRLTTRSELRKLLLYKHGENRISREDVEAIVSDAAALNLDAAINAAFSGRLDLVEETVQQAFASGGDPGMLIGMAARHAVMLHRARLDHDKGTPRDAAIEKAARKAFIFARKEVLIGQLERWRSDGLSRAIEILSGALQELRKEARLAEVIASRAFWSITYAAKRGGR